MSTFTNWQQRILSCWNYLYQYWEPKKGAYDRQIRNSIFNRQHWWDGWFLNVEGTTWRIINMLTKLHLCLWSIVLFRSYLDALELSTFPFNMIVSLTFYTISFGQLNGYSNAFLVTISFVLNIVCCIVLHCKTEQAFSYYEQQWKGLTMIMILLL